MYNKYTKRREKQQHVIPMFLCYIWINIISCEGRLQYRHTITPKATTKIIKQRVMAIKPRKEIQWNHEKYSADFKKAEKIGECRTKNRWKIF